ncbi:flagellar basal body rod modification protein [Campylobacter pinnipediorum]|uniref:Basal-body rod modification protein FlgD n=1 Tax=Campylobacter pinnipediorum subsp. pinnipediorum TaxID=1660067 RepID=A0AAX0L8L4_9BACT|nr:flagellar basal body rod modification protein [Campylobacter pinnipediorum]AQW80728.1 flagellar hook assembly protein [Campylobacter pinnipediorum subsp. pinnipediorum]AQW82395.1 flagellar hook assembly protein [Campylobacter pinnipediorum subsp. pinnipediorum]AQW84065.1 flagellar hook assembly protein [Campylobacter pinnipediorum subsp. pinnipediorum]OPA74443.1 flagellar biosynthesis protein FlgD [Campylobacter pinnipediorum subsp. pinnipediorum]OPA76502.1 flagellar biosynthesis protein Fl
MASITDTNLEFTADKRTKKLQDAKNQKADGTNPSAHLDKDAFMKLLLTELKYQDPTSPMDTEKMLTQTSQLATLEMQENTNSAMKELVSQLKSNSSMYALSALGKMANLGTDRVLVKEETQTLDIPIYFKDEVKSGVIEILDSNSNVIRKFSLEKMPAGTHKIKWDLSTDTGGVAKPGSYQAKATYKDPKDEAHTALYGTYPVEAVKFIDGKANVRIGGEYKSVEEVSEFF